LSLSGRALRRLWRVRASDIRGFGSWRQAGGSAPSTGSSPTLRPRRSRPPRKMMGVQDRVQARARGFPRDERSNTRATTRLVPACHHLGGGSSGLGASKRFAKGRAKRCRSTTRLVPACHRRGGGGQGGVARPGSLKKRDLFSAALQGRTEYGRALARQGPCAVPGRATPPWPPPAAEPSLRLRLPRTDLRQRTANHSAHSGLASRGAITPTPPASPQLAPAASAPSPVSME
jgi:hypothetical protein